MSDLSPWRLPDLLKVSGISLSRSIPDVPVHRVTDDSREVTPGTLFVAVQGAQADGHRFIPQAVQRGARVILIEQEVPVPDSVVSLKVPSTRSVLGPLAHAFHGSPSHRLSVVGVTGTNGKTTVAWLIRHLLEEAQIPCGLIGTVCVRVGDAQRKSDNTTPGVVPLQETLAEMVSLKLRACSMEVSSHALDQHRVDGIRWACGIFTNLTPEHLDYHRTMEQYLQAKLRLFESLGSDAAAVINRDDPVWEKVRQSTRARVFTYGINGSNRVPGLDLSVSEVQCMLEGTRCRLHTPEGTFSVAWRLIGRHNLENLLAATGALMGIGVSLKRGIPGVESFSGVPGRLERIEAGQPFPVFVDYAHTDGALTSVLQQLRACTSRRILVVFGCGGDRDRTKRPRMGRVAAELADRVIITSDNPRSEDPREIAAEVAQGLKGTSTPWGIVLDRREAIRSAVESADPNWVVLIAGKGHENEQILRDRTVPFDDRVVVREFLKAGERVTP